MLICSHIFVYKIHHSTTITRHHEQQNLISSHLLISHTIPHAIHPSIPSLKSPLIFFFSFYIHFPFYFIFLISLIRNIVQKTPSRSLTSPPSLPPSFIYFVFISWWYNINFNKNYMQKKYFFFFHTKYNRVSSESWYV